MAQQQLLDMTIPVVMHHPQPEDHRQSVQWTAAEYDVALDLLARITDAAACVLVEHPVTAEMPHEERWDNPAYATLRLTSALTMIMTEWFGVRLDRTRGLHIATVILFIVQALPESLYEAPHANS